MSMYSEILNQISSKYDQENIIIIIDDLLDSFFTTGQNFEEILKSKVPANLAVFFKKDQVFLNDLKKQILDMQIINLTIAVNLSKDSLSKIVNWVKKTIGSNYLVSFDLNENIIGGVQIEHKGKFLDYSVKKYLNITLNKW